MNQTHPFTCNTCQVAFRTSDLQRTHMQSDWHRYNLKRRVASLPPLSSEIFAEKVLANKASAAATAARASYEQSCQACQRTYYSQNAFTNHLSSQKHKGNASKVQRINLVRNGDDDKSLMSSTFSLGDPIETASNSVVTEESDADEVTSISDGLRDASINSDSKLNASAGQGLNADVPTKDGPILTCLFCNYASPSFPLNISHMQRSHDLFIPETDYLADKEGLIGYLWAKVTEGHECLYCGKQKHTTTGIMTHMRDRGHCKIAFESEEEQLEIGQFYDFSSTYSDPEAGDSGTESDVTDRQGAGVKLGAKRDAQTSVEGQSEEEDDTLMDDEGWETDSTSSSLDGGDTARLRSNTASSLPNAVYHDDFELHMPSGRTAGHRSMNKYWRQNLRSHPSPAERVERLAIEAASGEVEAGGAVPARNGEQRAGRDERRQLASLRANGGMGMVGVTDAARKEVGRAEKRERGRARRADERRRAGNERRGNFQQHFRDPLLQ